MLTENKNILIKSKSIKGFTLVELIIVITILAILATIAFVSFQGYTKNTRDANRLDSMNSMSKGLEIYLVKNSTLPHPETPVIVYDSSETIGYQGYFGDDVARLTGFDKNPKDPLDGSKYTYLTSSDYKKYQLLSLLETSDYLTFSNNIFPKAFADGVNYSKRFPKTFGNDLGVLLGNGANEVNKPVQEKLSASFTGINIDTDISYKAVVNNSKSVFGSNIKILKNTIKNTYDSSLIGYWNMETSYTSGSTSYMKDLSGNGVDCQYNAGGSITNGLKGKALLTSNTNPTTILCRNLFTDKKPFSLFMTYKVNQTNIPMNASNSDVNLDETNSSGIFSIQQLSTGYFSYNIYNGNYNMGAGLATTYEGKKLNKEISTTNWNITTLVYDGEKYKTYDNGKYMESLNATSYVTNGSVLHIPRGLTPNNIIYYGDLTLDDTKLYNRALDDSEINKIYNQMK